MLVIVLGVGIWFGWQAYYVYRGITTITKISAPRVTGEPIKPLPPVNGNKPFNVLVLGSDTDRKSEEKRPLTQSIIVVHVNPARKTVGLLSVPRDFWVPIRGHGFAKIDLAFKYGDVQLVRQTVEQQFHIYIDYYAWVGLQGFRSVIDTFGGINLDISHPILDDFYPDDLKPSDPYAIKRVFIPAGWRHLSGRQALEYVRSRHGDAIGDFGRSSRQQQILVQIRRKADTFSILTHLPNLVDDLSNSVRTDLGVMEIYQLEKLSRQIPNAAIQRLVLSVPTYCRYAQVNSSIGVQDILQPNWSAINPAVHKLFTAPPPPVARIPAPTPTPIPEPQSTSTSPTPTTAPRATPTPTEPTLGRLPGTLIYVRDGNAFRLTPDRKAEIITPNVNAIGQARVSPDGKYLAYVRFSTSYASDLYTRDLRTGVTRQITHDAAPKVYNNLWAAFPTWSADERTLLFATDRAKLAITPATEARPVDLAIWSVPARGGTPTQVSHPATGVGIGGGGDTDPIWRPGTKQFLYVAWNYNLGNSTPYSQFKLSAVNGAAPNVLTPPSGRVLQPAFDAHGKTLTWVRGWGNVSQIVSAPLLDSRTSPRLGPVRVLAQGQVAQPAFTPDGSWISYLQAEGDNFILYMVPSKGGTPQRIAEAGSNLDALAHPIWVRSMP